MDGEKNRNACKRWRNKLKEDQVKFKTFKLKNNERNRNARQEKKKMAERDVQIIEERKKYERTRKRELRKKVKELKRAEKNEILPYSCKQTFGKALRKLENALPADLERKHMLIKALHKKYVGSMEREENKKKGLKAVNEKVAQAVKEFYTMNDISVQSSGKKDTMFSEGQLVAKRFLLMTVSEAYELYKNENTNMELIGKSTFFGLRPRHVQLIDKMPHNMCVCVYHANFGYLLQSFGTIIPSFPTNFESFLKSVYCNIYNENCMTNICKKCITDIKYQVIPLAYWKHMEDEVNWQHWLKNDKQINLCTANATFSGLISVLETKLPSFKTHFFVKRVQQEYFQKIKANLKPTELAIQIDFAENYRLANQNEIQSAHFTYRQARIFTCVAWLAGSTKSFAVISDKLTHNKIDVFIFLMNLLTEIEKLHGCFSKVYIFSEGCCSQFKNKWIMSSLFDFVNHLKCASIEWNFFASSHGKGAVDGVGAVIKKKVWQITRSRKVVIPDAFSFYEYAKNNIDNVNIYFLSSDNIEEQSIEYNLKEKWNKIKNIHGISKLHYFYCNAHELKAARIASSDEKKLI